MTHSSQPQNQKLYYEYRLGETVNDVVSAFYAQSCASGLHPFGLDVHQGFEFFRSPQDGRLYRLISGTLGATPMNAAEEAAMAQNLKEGAVELYLRRPSERNVLTQRKTLLHAASGRGLSD